MVCSGWAALKAALDDLAMARRSIAERVDIVLRSAWGGDPTAAARILGRWPEIATHDLYIAAATGRLAEVNGALLQTRAPLRARADHSTGSHCSTLPMRAYQAAICSRSIWQGPC